MRMKKFLGVFMSVVLVCSFMACGKETGKEPSKEPAVQTFEIEDTASNEKPAAEKPVSEGTVEEGVASADNGEDVASGDNGEGVALDSQYEQIKGYYKNYLSEGLQNEGVFTSPETHTVIYEPKIAVCDLNGDNYDDIIVAGYLGLRCKELTEIYYYNDGSFCTADIGGTPYGISNGGFLVHDPDKDNATMTFYEDDYVYVLGFNEAVEKLGCLVVESEGDGENSVVSKTYRLDGSEATEQVYQEYFAPYGGSREDISYEDLTLEVIQQKFAMD